MNTITDPDLFRTLERGAAAAARCAWPRCSDCNEPTDAGLGPRCERCAVKARRSQRVLARAHVPERYAVALESAELAARVRDGGAIARAQSWPGADRLVFIGPSGIGKTTLAAAIFRSRVETDASIESARFVSAQALALASRSTAYGRPSELEQLAIDAALVLLDDVGQEGSGRGGAVKNTVDLRYESSRPTIITTGLTASQLLDLYGAGTARRILGAHALVVKLERLGPAPDYKTGHVMKEAAR